VSWAARGRLTTKSRPTSTSRCEWRVTGWRRSASGVRAHRADPRQRDDVGLLLVVAATLSSNDRRRQQRGRRFTFDPLIFSASLWSRPQSYRMRGIIAPSLVRRRRDSYNGSPNEHRRATRRAGRPRCIAQRTVCADSLSTRRTSAIIGHLQADGRRAFNRHRQGPRHLGGQRAQRVARLLRANVIQIVAVQQPARPGPHVGAGPPAGRATASKRSPRRSPSSRRWTTVSICAGDFDIIGGLVAHDARSPRRARQPHPHHPGIDQADFVLNLKILKDNYEWSPGEARRRRREAEPWSARRHPDLRAAFNWFRPTPALDMPPELFALGCDIVEECVRRGEQGARQSIA